MLTEDETFKKLKRMPIKEFYEYYSALAFHHIGTAEFNEVCTAARDLHGYTLKEIIEYSEQDRLNTIRELEQQIAESKRARVGDQKI